jgi:hypothetical protein
MSITVKATKYIGVFVVDPVEIESIEDNSTVFIEIKSGDEVEKRRACQNRLYWGWLTDMQKSADNANSGVTKDEWHYRMKLKFLVPILERDDEEYAVMLESLREVKRSGLKTECAALLKHIVNETSTTSASVKQFCEYLNDIERFSAEIGARLRTDAHLYNNAMGIK